MHQLLLTSLLVISLCLQAVAQQANGADTLFVYDRSQLLDLRDSVVESTNHWKVHDVSYKSPRTGRVTGYLVTPTKIGKHAGILFGHWGSGNRSEFLFEAKLYAQAGVVSLMVDYPWVRPDPYQVNWIEGFGEPEKNLSVFTQVVVDLRRGLDLLLSRPDVDTNRIAYVGHSFGAQWGAILTAVDKRMKATVLMTGVPSDSVFWVESDAAWIVAERAKVTKEQLATYLRIVTAPLAAISYVPRAKPIPLFFQFATREAFSLEAMNRYYKAASEPKAIKWYNTGHSLKDPQALIDRAEWLEKHLAIKSLKSIVSKSLK